MTSLSYTFVVDQSPEAAFAAINDARAWWVDGTIDGPTDELGAEFVYRYKDLHYSKQRITELVPGKRVAWQVLDSSLRFVEDETEWNGTTITFDIATKNGKTEVQFTHVGLGPDDECYDACSSAWASYVNGRLRKRIENDR
jgi:hypothetical protein